MLNSGNRDWNQKTGLTIEKIVTDYLTKLHTALSRLQDRDTFKNGYYQTFQIEKSRYCLACPQSQQVFMGKCFIDAGIIHEHELPHRLTFVTESEAAAYNCLAWDRKSSRIKVDEHFLVCDIGHSTFGISRIDAKATESQSTVKLISEDFQHGSADLEKRFRSYIETNADSLNVDKAKIDEAVIEFTDNLKVCKTCLNNSGLVIYFSSSLSICLMKVHHFIRDKSVKINKWNTQMSPYQSFRRQRSITRP